MMARFEQAQDHGVGLVLGVEIGLGGQLQLAADVEILERARLQLRQGGRAEIDQVLAGFRLQAQRVEQGGIADQLVGVVNKAAAQALPVVEIERRHAAIGSHGYAVASPVLRPHCMTAQPVCEVASVTIAALFMIGVES